MALLSETGHRDLAPRFVDLDGFGTIARFTRSEPATGGLGDPCSYGEEAVHRAQELASLSAHISAEIHDILRPDGRTGTEFRVGHGPAWIGVRPHRQHFGIQFIGIPSGCGFSTLIADLIPIGKATPDLSPQTVAELQQLESGAAIRTFVTPTCPRAVLPADQMAMASPRVTADAFEPTEFPRAGPPVPGPRGAPDGAKRDRFGGRRGSGAPPNRDGGAGESPKRCGHSQGPIRYGQNTFSRRCPAVIQEVR